MGYLTDDLSAEIEAALWALVPTALVRLYSTMPDTSNAGGVELTVSGYSAQTITLATFWGNTGRIFSSLAGLNFGTAGADTPDIIGLGIDLGVNRTPPESNKLLLGFFSAKWKTLSGSDIIIPAGALISDAGEP